MDSKRQRVVNIDRALQDAYWYDEGIEQKLRAILELVTVMAKSMMDELGEQIAVEESNNE